MVLRCACRRAAGGDGLGLLGLLGLSEVHQMAGLAAAAVDMPGEGQHAAAPCMGIGMLILCVSTSTVA